ncbi:hypothetical protein [Streptomyces sp. NPDC056670]|uniref:hypothetical protein n=1 Tax=Streptomyces sp. NPDC056670 TaxID=3345904 RepID=UPI00368AAEF8
MEIAQIVLDYLKALVWPLIVLFVALAFKDEFRRLLDRLTEVKGAGFGAAFGEGVRRAQSVAEAAISEDPSASELANSPIENVFDAFRDIADSTPEGAVLAAWRAVEQKMIEAVSVVRGPEYLASRRALLPTNMIRELSNAGLSPMAVVALGNLFMLRHRATHVVGDAIDVAEGRSYVDAAELGVRLLNSFVGAYDRPNGSGE